MDPNSHRDLGGAYLRQRARFLRHLVDDGCNVSDAERLIAGWEREAARVHRSRSSTGYWKDAWLWIADEATHRPVVAKRDMNAAADGQVYGG